MLRFAGVRLAIGARNAAVRHAAKSAGKKRVAVPAAVAGPSAAVADVVEVERSGAGADLATFHPGIASCWIAAVSSKMLHPQHVAPTSRKMVWWHCPACRHQHTKRIDLHVAATGECPKCSFVPPASLSLLPPTSIFEELSGTGGPRPDAVALGEVSSLKRHKPAKKGSATAVAKAATAVDSASPTRLTPTPSVKHRSRTPSTQSSLAAENENRIQKSIADDGYLRSGDTRNLMPMLAKSYLDVCDKIDCNERLFTSPKLDGIRCIVSYDSANSKLNFFSRTGTLFECCDAVIEPALLPLFQLDPTLVLDGELYNHDEAENFEVLVSAIRTRRSRRTPAVLELQKKLEFHVFDVLYAQRLAEWTPAQAAASKDSRSKSSSRSRSGSRAAGNFFGSPRAKGSSAVPPQCPYSVRYEFLKDCISLIDACHSTPSPIKLVPAHKTHKKDIEKTLHRYLDMGYEGIMVRRDSEIGYAYGARSAALMKYKLMQDDEFVIVDVVEGKGKWKNALGAFVCRTKSGEHFTVAPATSLEMRTSIWKNWKRYKGKVLTVQYQQLSANGIPRFPVGKCVRGAGNGSDWI